MLPENIQKQLNQAQKLPPFPEDYIPQTIEFFDQYGVMVGMVNGEYVEQHERPADYDPWYLALFFDGEMAFCGIGSNIVLNRLQNLPELLENFDFMKEMGNQE